MPISRIRGLDLVAYAALVLLAMVAVIGPSNLAWSGRFMARGLAPGDASIVAGDHLQLTYALWLWPDALTGGGHAPWTDPYLFGSSGGGMTVLFGWPIVVYTVPVSLVCGPIAAYNAAVCAGFLLAALFTAAWVRSLGTSTIAAAAAGLAFAFAPFRVVQSVAHGNALLAWMLPLLAWCLERALRGDDQQAQRWAWAAVATQVSIMVGGEFHHAVFAALFTGTYVLVRMPGAPTGRLRHLLTPGMAGILITAFAAGLLYVTVIAPSSAKHGRTIDEAAHFAPRPADFVRPALKNHHYERFVYVGAVIAGASLIAVAAAALRHRRRLMVVVLTSGIAACAWFAMAPSFVDKGALQKTYQMVPFFSFSRTPGRLMVIGALLLSAMVGLGVDALGDRARRWMLIPFALFLVLDLPAPLFEAVAAGGNPYEGLREGASILEMPAYDPGDYVGSVYSMYVIRHPGPRVGGYFVIVPADRDEPRQLAARLEADPGDGCGWIELMARAPVDYVAAHSYLLQSPDSERLVQSLRNAPGLHELREQQGVTVFEVVPTEFVCQRQEPR